MITLKRSLGKKLFNLSALFFKWLASADTLVSCGHPRLQKCPIENHYWKKKTRCCNIRGHGGQLVRFFFPYVNQMMLRYPIQTTVQKCRNFYWFALLKKTIISYDSDIFDQNRTYQVCNIQALFCFLVHPNSVTPTTNSNPSFLWNCSFLKLA